jgi:transposase
MLKDTRATMALEVPGPVLELPVETRGSRREGAKRRRRMQRVEGKTLVIGLDVARERQALTFGHGRAITGRRRIDVAPQHLGAAIVPVTRQLCEREGLDRVVVGLEPAGCYWELAAEGFEREGLDYVLVHTLAVKREREVTRYNQEKHDPRDADLIFGLVCEAKFTETRLIDTPKRATLNALAREYMLLRKRVAAERTRMTNFWTRVLPEFFDVFSAMEGVTALAVSLAVLPFSELAALAPSEWLERVRRHAHGRVLPSRVAALQQHVRTAQRDPHRRAGDAIPRRIAFAAERHHLLRAQKQRVRDRLLALYPETTEAAWLNSIPGSDPLYNALTLALVGDFSRYDSARTLVKLAGSEVNWHESGDWRGKSRISHRGRSLLRAAAYQQARRLVRNNPTFCARYHHLLSRTTRPALAQQQAYMAIANSYLRTAHVLVTQGKTWEAQPAKRG